MFERKPLDDGFWKIDSSEFDNTKPGVYNIYVSFMAYSAYDKYEVKGSFNVVVADIKNTPGPVTTSPGTTAATTNTTTTTAEWMTSTYATEYHTFKEVVSYPTKTEYAQGEKLTFEGLECEFEGERTDLGYYKNSSYCEVLDNNGNRVNGSAFSTLPTGEYTVRFFENITYRSCPMHYYSGMDISYKVTIREATEEELKEREEQKEKEMEEENDPDPSYGFVWGDANLDRCVDMADAVLIMQSLANPNKYGLLGTSNTHIRKSGLIRGDVDTSTAGLTSNDALFIQRYLLKKIPTLDPNG